MTQAQIGFARGAVVFLIGALLDYIGNNIGASGIVSASVATIISGLSLSLEHYLSSPGTALFGSVSVKNV